MDTPTRALGRKACEQDDTALLDQVISTIPDDDPDQVHNYLRKHAIRNNASKVLNNLAKRGVDFTRIWPSDILGDTPKTSKETLEFLRAHGWNINWRDTKKAGSMPFMWSCINNYDMVSWCLELGASVRPAGVEPLSEDFITLNQCACPQILERVAQRGSVAVFELLRLRGAPLGWRTLHLAVESATLTSEYPLGVKKRADIETRREERLAIVRHLIDVVKIDVNALDRPAVADIRSNWWGTPICYILGSQIGYISDTPGLKRDARELTWLLLDRGADPTPALKVAKEEEYHKFVEDVEAWKAKKGNEWKCCVQ